MFESGAHNSLVNTIMLQREFEFYAVLHRNKNSMIMHMILFIEMRYSQDQHQCSGLQSSHKVPVDWEAG